MALNEENRVYLQDDCYIDFERSVFVNKNLPCALTQQEIRLLKRMNAKAGSIATYKELTDYLSDQYDSTFSQRELQIFISRLRKKIGEINTTYLLSVRGVGYVFLPDKEI
ncbi:helix-turn-helix domain-containing protein [Cohnella soli]|uniref:Helix-turn-helix domain-containing protein n=1 Tax=Cohnella soli TaxID=425005 RepID=A0ABW0HNI3_9BACL